MAKPRLKQATVIAEYETDYNMEIVFDNGHKATLKVLKDEESRYSAKDFISEMYIYRNLFGQHNFRRESEEEKVKARLIIDSAIKAFLQTN